MPLIADAGHLGPVWLAWWSVLALVPASELAIALVNRAVAHVVAPRPLPELDLSDGHPRASSARSSPSRPCSPTRRTSRTQIDRLEVHYLANADGDIRFALLSDWLDAAVESVPGDEALLAAAVGGHRAPERDATATPRAAARASSSSIASAAGTRRRAVDGLGAQARQAPRAQRAPARRHDHDFLVSELAGTQPPERRPLRHHARRRHAAAARRRGALVGTMAHPLNRPRFDPRSRRVVDGLRAPPAAHHADAARPSRRLALPARLLRPGGHRPLHGRGLRRVPGPLRRGQLHRQGHLRRRRLRAALAGRVPENALLSHDLFEGIFARAGLVTDIELFEEFPSRYEEAAARQHRWARGDWQLLPWIRRCVRRRIATAHRTLEDARQPPPLAVGADGARHPVAAWTLPGVPRGHVDPVRARVGRRCRRSSRSCPASSRDGRTSRSAATCARWPRTSPSPPVAIALAVDVPGPPGVAHGRRHRADARAALRHAADLLEWVTAAQAKAQRRPRRRWASTGAWPDAA